MKISQALTLLLAARSAFGFGDLSATEAGRQLTTGDACEAVTSCDSEDHVCTNVNGHKYWSVHTMTSTNCLTRCVDGRDLAFMKLKGYKCGECPENSCSAAHECSGGFHLFRIKDGGNCEDKCTKERDIKKKLLDKNPWSCGMCEEPMDSIDAQVRSGQKIDCRGWDFNDPALPAICKELPPTPEKCVLKRAKQIQRYEPNWPFLEEGVHIEIQVEATGNIYKFGDVEGAVNSIQDIAAGEFHIDDFDIFTEMKEGNSIQLRYVSPRGPGGWNTCKYSPIAFDLNNDALVEMVDIPGGFQFDITGDGEMETLTKWFGPAEGILIYLGHKLKNRDIEESIAISGQALMGDMGMDYSSGYEKLQNHDKDSNGIIEGGEMKGFYLWMDVNQNYHLDSGELHELKEYNIQGFSTKHENYKSEAYLKDGGIMLTEDLWLSRRR